MAKLSIKLEEWGQWGWWWRVSVNGGESTDYRTNDHGDGLWCWEQTTAQWVNGDGTREPVYEWRQITGTCQFGLPLDRRRAYQKIRRLFAD